MSNNNITIIDEAVPHSNDELGTKLNKVNYANFIGFIINFVLTYGSTNGIFPGSSNTVDLSLKYQTFVTPKSTGFAIWGLIFIFQGLFTITQMLPKYRMKSVVQSLGFSWLFVCLVQSLWSLMFAYELIIASLILMVLIFGGLVTVNINQYQSNLERSLSEFWLLRFPFMLHLGWITAATLLNVNVVFVDQNAPSDVQLTVGIISLAILHAVSLMSLVFPKYPAYVIPCVLVWATSWIGAELENPQTSIQEKFGSLVVDGVKNAAYSIAVIISIQVVARAGYSIFSCAKLQRENIESNELMGNDNAESEPQISETV